MFVIAFREGPWHAERGVKSSLINLCEHTYCSSFLPSTYLQMPIQSRPLESAGRAASLHLCLLNTVLFCMNSAILTAMLYKDTLLASLCQYFILRHSLALHFRLAPNLKPWHLPEFWHYRSEPPHNCSYLYCVCVWGGGA